MYGSVSFSVVKKKTTDFEILYSNWTSKSCSTTSLYWSNVEFSENPSIINVNNYVTNLAEKILYPEIISIILVFIDQLIKKLTFLVNLVSIRVT